MEILGTVVNAFVVAAVGLLLAWLANARFKEMSKEMNRRFDGVDRRFEQVDRRFEEMERRMDSFQGSLDSLRSDLTQVALAVGASRGTSGQRR